MFRKGHRIGRILLHRELASCIPKRSLSTTTTVISIALGIPLGMYTYKSVMMVLFQNKIIYMPYLPPGARHETEIPKASTNYYFRKEKLQTIDNCTLEGISIANKEEEERKPNQVLVYFHGNAGNVSHRFPVFNTILRALPDTTIVSFNYRGYGGSTGSPSEQGLQQDSVCILSYVQKKFPNSRVILYGHSLGGAVAAYLTHQVETNPTEVNHVVGLILENTFTSITGMVYHLYPAWLPYRYLTKWFLWNRWDTDTLMKQIHRTPVLILTSERDAIVPTEMMNTLWESLEPNESFNRSKIVKFPYGTHEDTFKQPGFKKEIRDFVNSIR
ncbi:hypothetical protein K7432_001917 [Basidiobolus ranarum]|uniref:AB hydrolase-1 domain-containing protein n=1 Tax=Basidiobolus ranarum TaxID=34480 RepID=A0ABR2X284_9FUNG